MRASLSALSLALALPSQGEAAPRELDEDEYTDRGYSEASGYEGKVLQYESKLLDYEESLLDMEDKLNATGEDRRASNGWC